MLCWLLSSFLILLFLLSNQSNWIMFLISRFYSSHSQIFFSSTIFSFFSLYYFNFMMFVIALFFTIESSCDRPMTIFLFPLSSSTFFLCCHFPTVNLRKMLFTKNLHESGRNKILFMISVNKFTFFAHFHLRRREN